MGTQRRSDAADSARDGDVSRRGFLAAGGAAAATALFGGCVSRVSGATSSESDPVELLGAGSLQRAFGEGLTGATSTRLHVETHGSVTCARLVASGRRDPDVVALADTALFDGPLDAPWHAEFATNALVVACNDSAGGRRVANADRWFDPVLADEATLGRTDPDLDPLGYRTLFALELGEEYYDRPDLRESLVHPGQIYPETSLLSRFETGAVDAAVVYRNMAVERGYDFVDLPAAIDLGSPDRDEHYATAQYALGDGTTVTGESISYGVRARRLDGRVQSVYDSLVGGSYLESHGFGVPEGFPRYHGSVPESLGR